MVVLRTVCVVYRCAEESLTEQFCACQVVGYGNVAFIVGGLDLNAADASNKLYK